MEREFPSLHGMVFEIMSAGYENEHTICIRMTSMREDAEQDSDNKVIISRDHTIFGNNYNDELFYGMQDLHYVKMFDHFTDSWHSFPDDHRCAKKVGQFFCDVVNAYENASVFNEFCTIYKTAKLGASERSEIKKMYEEFGEVIGGDEQGEPIITVKDNSKFIHRLEDLNNRNSLAAYAEAVLATVFYYEKYTTVTPIDSVFEPQYFSVQGYDPIAQKHHTRILTNVDMLMYDYSEMLRRGIRARHCKNCEKLFVPTSRSDEVYCDNVFKDGKTCKEIGFAAMVEKDAVLQAYRTIYKTQHARLRRSGKDNEYIRVLFENWRKFANNQLHICQSGKITIEQMKKRISKSDWLEGVNYADNNETE